MSACARWSKIYKPLKSFSLVFIDVITLSFCDRKRGVGYLNRLDGVDEDAMVLMLMFSFSFLNF
jgi:hypothetical protein